MRFCVALALGWVLGGCSDAEADKGAKKNAGSVAGASGNGSLGGGTLAQAGTPAAGGDGGDGGRAGAAQAGSGGSAAAGAPAESVQPCPALPQTGVWEDITPTKERGLDGVVYNSQALLLDPFDASTLWLGTARPNMATADARSGLFKSSDCGATWAHVDSGENANALDRSSLWSMAIDPVERGVMYTVGANGALGLFKSSNAGVDWHQLFPPESEFAKHVQANFVGAIVMDPTDHRHLVVTSHGACSAPYGSGSSACQAETLDAGATWTIVPNPDALGFQENAGAYLLGPDNWIYADPATSTYRTTDHGKTWQVVGPGAQGGEGRARPILTADGAYYLPSDHGVLKSADQGGSWSMLANSPMSFAFAIGDRQLYTCPEFSASFRTASLADPTHWTALPSPALRAPNWGAAFLDYDDAHHILYSSSFQGGLFRMVTR